MAFARTTYHRMWEARSKHARDVAEQRHVGGGSFFMKHCHLPRSIWAARVVWSRWDAGSSGVMVDIVECPGCCDGPYGMTTTCSLMETVSRSCLLQLGPGVGEADECYGQRVALGDYGDYSDGNFVRVGNIFEDMPAPGIGSKDSTYCPVVSPVSSSDWLPACMHNQDDLAVAYRYGEPPLALYQPKGISLPTNEHMSLLLKALSTRLSGKTLVKTIIQCSDFYVVDKDGKRRDSGDGSGNYSAEARILTPLCIIARPRVWRRELPSEHRREQIKCIREHFYALVNNHQPSTTEPSHKSTVRQEIM
ncbi:hypothetical protein EDD15DRAFT_1646486 [Pisolithus albus]|nr:hypothetical protein EDD15DRAFT_1646486 [Pisolithus albus]